MDTWKTGQNFKKGSFQSREDFYSKLNTEHITENDNKQTKTKVNIVTIKNLGENPDLHVLSDTLLLANILEILGVSKHNLDPEFLFSIRISFNCSTANNKS